MKRIFIALIGVMLASCGSHAQNNTATQDKPADFAKLLAMQKQLAEELPPLENVEYRTVSIPFITKADTVAIRKVHMFIPEAASRPMPVVYIPHYEMKDDALELRSYLAEGWSVVSPTEFDNSYNGMLTDDDLVFNNAALFTIRHTPDFDSNRILLVGGSAGGYMTMMLNGLQMGICGSIADAPIENLFFNFYQLFPAAGKFNKDGFLKVLLKHGKKLTTGTDEEKIEAFMSAMMEMPLPYIGLVSGMFEPILNNFPDKEDYARWEALSPVGLGECFSSPFIVHHCTSDLLVPVDQTTRKFTYERNGESMPEGFSTRLDPQNPGKLGLALDDVLPKELTRVKSFPIIPVDSTEVVDYDPVKPFNINISDDGPVERYGSHNSGNPSGTVDMIPYLKDMASRSLAYTEMLRPGKVRLLLERYAGRSVQLPAHVGIDDNVYGSLSVYRQEVVEEMNRYVQHHSLQELEDVVRVIIVADSSLKDCWEDIRPRLGSGK